MKRTMPIKLLHIGVGTRGRDWLEIVAHHPDYVSVGCVDPSEEALAVTRVRLPGQDHGNFFDERGRGARAHGRGRRAGVEPDVCARSARIQALDAGLPVLVEKPFAATSG